MHRFINRNMREEKLETTQKRKEKEQNKKCKEEDQKLMKKKNESSRDIAVSVRTWLSSGRCHGSIPSRGKRFFNPLKPNDLYTSRTATLTSKR